MMEIERAVISPSATDAEKQELELKEPADAKKMLMKIRDEKEAAG